MAAEEVKWLGIRIHCVATRSTTAILLLQFKVFNSHAICESLGLTDVELDQFYQLFICEEGDELHARGYSPYPGCM